jgi:hypothetical protein
MSNRDLIKGRSESLNKSITEVMKFLGDNDKRRDGLGVDLRGVFHDKLADFARYWFKRGVRRGHIESHKKFKATGMLSAKLRYNGKKEFFAGQERPVRVTSRIKTRQAQQVGTKRNSR